MTDIFLETVRVMLVAVTVLALYRKSRSTVVVQLPGSTLILIGLVLLVLGMLVDLSDNFPALNRFVVLGDTPSEAFVEKVIGSLLGYALVGVGLLRWVPAWIEHDRSTRERLDTATHDLEQLSSLVPICSYCKKIRDDDGYWGQIEQYIEKLSGSGLTHGMCPECYDRVMREDGMGAGTNREKTGRGAGTTQK